MCLWVLVGHTCRQTGMRLPVLRSPHYAVDGFMILSGFLMAYHSLIRSEREPLTQLSTWTAFYIRRYFRISPLYYLLLIPAYLLSESFLRWRTATDHFLGIPRPLENIQHFSLPHLLVHLTYVFGLLPSYHASTVLPDWSLSLEMQFYVMFPFLMLFVLRFGWLLSSVVASAIWLFSSIYASHLARPFVQPSPLPLSLLWFVIGMVWASAYLESPGPLPNGRGSATPCRPAKILFAASLSLLSRDPHDIILVSIFAWILFADGWVSLGRSAHLVRRVLSGKLSSFLARASYSVYLLHLLILTPVAYFLCTQFQLPVQMRFVFALTTTIVACYGLARPLEVFENWGIAEGKRLSRKVTRKSATTYRRGTASFLPNANPVDI